MRASRRVSHPPKHRLSGDEKQGNDLASAPVVNGIVLCTISEHSSECRYTQFALLLLLAVSL